MIKILTFCAVLTLANAALASPDPGNCPMHEAHMKAASTKASVANGSREHGAGVDGRHDTMGMSHQTTNHSFRLFADGGAIELRANDPADQAAVTAIRTHIQEIADQFSKKDFSTPGFVHGYAPDGVEQMKKLHSSINYLYEEVSAGARIRIRSSNPEALAAIHEFLEFQVVEHRTGDRGVMEEDR